MTLKLRRQSGSWLNDSKYAKISWSRTGEPHGLLNLAYFFECLWQFASGCVYHFFFQESVDNLKNSAKICQIFVCGVISL